MDTQWIALFTSFGQWRTILMDFENLEISNFCENEINFELTHWSLLTCQLLVILLFSFFFLIFVYIQINTCVFSNCGASMLIWTRHCWSIKWCNLIWSSDISFENVLAHRWRNAQNWYLSLLRIWKQSHLSFPPSTQFFPEELRQICQKHRENSDLCLFHKVQGPSVLYLNYWIRSDK